MDELQVRHLGHGPQGSAQVGEFEDEVGSGGHSLQGLRQTFISLIDPKECTNGTYQRNNSYGDEDDAFQRMGRGSTRSQ